MHHYIHKSNKCATLYPLLCDKNSRKGRRRREGRGGGGRDGGETQEVLRQRLLLYAESHRDTSKFLRWTLDDHCRLSSVSYRLSNRVWVRARARAYAGVCAFLSTFLPSLYLSFVVFCSVCIIGKSLIFLLSWRWTIFDLLKQKNNVLWLLSNSLNILCFVLFFFFFSPDEKRAGF